MSANGVNNACEKYPPAESDEPDKLPLTDTNCKDISRNNKGESYLDLSAGKLEMLSKESKSQGTISEEPNISVSDCGKKLAKDADTRNKSVSSIESLEAEMMKVHQQLQEAEMKLKETNKQLNKAKKAIMLKESEMEEAEDEKEELLAKLSALKRKRSQNLKEACEQLKRILKEIEDEEVKMEAERLIHESDLRDKQRAIEDRQEREEKEVKEKRRNESRDKNH
ncbi:uncharacterized protein LOC142348327 [Convolutriloba macropyga]|uniref:uncharacterized protein LOC142348327 n=1 Tax=Convolutriloba macropyga TaxID=536237 RepID=UPI003F522F74